MAQGGFDSNDVPRSALYDEYGGAKQLIDVDRVKIEVPRIKAGESWETHVKPNRGDVWTNLMFSGRLNLTTRNEGDRRIRLTIYQNYVDGATSLLSIRATDGKIHLFTDDLLFGDVVRPRVENMSIIEIHQHMSMYNLSFTINPIIRINNTSDYDIESTNIRLFYTKL